MCPPLIGGTCEYIYYAFGIVQVTFGGDITVPSSSNLTTLFKNLPCPKKDIDIFVGCADNTMVRLKIDKNGNVNAYPSSVTTTAKFRGSVMYIAIK